MRLESISTVSLYLYRIHVLLYIQENMELRFDYEQARKENPRLKVDKISLWNLILSRDK